MITTRLFALALGVILLGLGQRATLVGIALLAVLGLSLVVPARRALGRIR